MRTGTWTEYGADGQVMLIATYKDGVLDGPWKQLVDGAVIEGTMIAGRARHVDSGPTRAAQVQTDRHRTSSLTGR